MGAIGRRRLLESAGVLLAAGRISAGNVVSPTIEGDNAGEPLLLRNFEPRSMLHVRETKVLDRKSTRLNSSHGYISYAVFCLKKKKKKKSKIIIELHQTKLVVYKIRSIIFDV